MIIRTVTMDDLNEVVELESDAFKMTKKQTEQDMIGRIENYPDTFLVAQEDGKVIGHIFGPAFNNAILKMNYILKIILIKKMIAIKWS